MRFHCEFDISVGAPAEDIRGAVLNNFCYHEVNVLVLFLSILYCIVLYCTILDVCDHSQR